MPAPVVLRWTVRALGIALAVLLVVAALGVWWVGQSTSFLRWSLGRAVAASDGALEIGTVRGTLLQGIRIDSLRWRDAARDIRLADASLRLRPDRLLQGEIRVSRVEIAEATVILRATPDATAVPALPESLELPVDVGIDALGIGRLAIEPASAAGTPGEPVVLERVSFAGRYRNGTYRITRLAASAPRWGEASLQGALGARPPYALEALVEAQPRLADASLPLAGGRVELPRIRVLADGTLDDFSLVAQALAPSAGAGSGEPQAPRPAWIGVETRVRPFARPLSAALAPIGITFDALEPAQFGASAAPAARLAGSATVRIDGDGASGEARIQNALPGPLDRNAVPLRTLEVRFAWSGSTLSLSALHATLADGGRIDGEAAIDFDRSLEVFGRRVPRVRGTASMRDVDLAQWQTRLEKTRLGGRIVVDGERLDAEVQDASRENIALATRLRLDGETLRIERARLGTPAGVLEAAGSASLAAPYRVDVQGRFAELDPERVEALAMRLGLLAGEPRLPGWGGRIGGSWAAQGEAWPALQLRTRLAIEQGAIADEPLRAQWSGDVTTARVARAELRIDFGALRASARGALGQAGDRLHFAVRAPSLRRFDSRLAGSADAVGELSGGWRDASIGLAGRISVRELAWEGRLRAGSVAGRIDLPDLAAGRMAVDLDARTLQWDARRIDRLAVRVDGDVAAHTVRIDVTGRDAAGRLVASGALASPAGQGRRWEGRLDTFDASEPLAVRLDAPAALGVDAHGFALGASSWRVDEAPVRVSSLAWRDGALETRGEAARIPLSRWARAFAPAVPDALEQAETEIGDVRLDAQWDLRGDDVTTLSGHLALQLQAGTAGESRGRAELALDEGRLAGNVDLRIPTLAFANRMIGPQWAVAGRLRFRGDVGGTIAAPRLNGDLDGQSLALMQRELGWRLTGGVLRARFEGDRLVVRELRLESGGGSIAMAGELRLEDLQGRFELRAERLPVPLGPGERVVVSGDSLVTSRGTALQWSGKLRADEGLIELRGGEAPRLPDDVVLLDDEAPASSGAPGGAAPAQRAAAAAAQPAGAAAAKGDEGLRVAADLKLDLGSNLRVRGSGVDVVLAGSLALRGTLPAAPLAYGTVDVREGTYAAYGQKLTITRGRVIFDGPLDNPVLDIVAMRTGQPVEAGVSLTGTVLSPRIRLVSKPEVPDSEKLSWLVLGVGFDDARSGAQMAALQAAAATLMGSSNGGVSGGLAHSLGLDVLTVRGANAGSVFDPDFGATFPGQTGAGTPTTNAEQNVVAIGKRLSSRVLVTYEQGLRGVWNLFRIQYEITDRLSLRAQTGTDTSLDLLYFYSFD